MLFYVYCLQTNNLQMKFAFYNWKEQLVISIIFRKSSKNNYKTHFYDSINKNYNNSRLKICVYYT